MGYQTFTCAICGKSGLSKRQTYKFDSNGARACREHEEVKKESVPDFNKAYFGFKVDPRCPEVAYSARILYCMQNFKNPHSGGLVVMAMNNLAELLKQPEHTRFARRLVPPKITTVDMWQSGLSEYEETLRKNLESALYDKDVIKDYIQKEVIPFYRGFLKLHIEGWMRYAQVYSCLYERIGIDAARILNPIRISDYYDPVGDHRVIQDLMIALGTCALRLKNESVEDFEKPFRDYSEKVQQALNALEKQGFQVH